LKPDDIKNVLDLHAKWVRGEPGGVRAYLRGADLRGAILSGSNLRGTSLIDVNLSGADLSDADLRDANLSDAGLRGAILSGAILSSADLRGAILSGAILSSADLRGAILIDADLCGADLRGAILIDADLCGADLIDADLNGARIGVWTVADGIVATWSGRYWSMTFPTAEGRVLRYGCEKRILTDWDGNHEALAKKHEPNEWKPYAAETEALVALCRALDVGEGGA
jgi:hypothetical protein